METITIHDPTYHSVVFSLPFSAGSITVTPEGEVEVEGENLTETAKAFWETILMHVPEHLKVKGDTCTCLTQVLMTAGCQCGHLKKSPS